MTLFPDPKTFISIGPLSIQWYAICILTGAFIALLIGQYNFKKYGFNKELLSDYFITLLIVGFIGARIWYVAFMFNELYSDNIIDIFRITNGGVAGFAIQGGVITGIAYSWWFFKKHNVDFFFAGDAILPGVLVAQAIGRWGNFINQEAYGGIVSLEFLKGLFLPQFIIDKMLINGNYRHPTFLYESVANIIGFLLIYFVIRKIQKKQGIQFFSYFIWYGVTRFFIEGLRTDSLYFLGMRTAQVTSIIFVIVGVVGTIWCMQKGKPVVEEKEA